MPNNSHHLNPEPLILNPPLIINTIGRYWRKKYGESVYKIPLSITGFTCPNIDGTVAKGGCTYCENESFSPNLDNEELKNKNEKLNLYSKENPFLEKQLLSIEHQYKMTKAKLSKKFGAKKFIMYFQSFSNTYAPLETLKALYEKALSFDDVVGLSIGTRTDCLSDEILDYLADLNKSYEIWLEFGIQSFFDETLKKINRGHNSANMIEWINKTKSKNLKVCAHLIYGLPDETEQMMLESLQKTIDLNVDSLKIHPLYVVKNTALQKHFEVNKFTPINEKAYLDTLVKSFKLIPTNITIQRLTAGISDDTLLAPKWCNNKHSQMLKIKEILKENNFIL
jgi:radical SAM protein (TIGR01212 family)